MAKGRNLSGHSREADHFQRHGPHAHDPHLPETRRPPTARAHRDGRAAPPARGRPALTPRGRGKTPGPRSTPMLLPAARGPSFGRPQPKRAVRLQDAGSESRNRKKRAAPLARWRNAWRSPRIDLTGRAFPLPWKRKIHEAGRCAQPSAALWFPWFASDIRSRREPCTKPTTACQDARSSKARLPASWALAHSAWARSRSSAAAAAKAQAEAAPRAPSRHRPRRLDTEATSRWS